MSLLFSMHLKKAYAQGLPIERKIEYKTGKNIIGTLDIKKTLKTFHLGNLVSKSRNKTINLSIILPLIKAYNLLSQKVSQDIQTQKIIQEFLSFSQGVSENKYDISFDKIKYTPMSIAYKPALKIAEYIIRNEKIGASSLDENQISMLFDVAEIWEHYCYKALKKQFPDSEIIYSENDACGFAVTGEKFKLKPDFIIKKHGQIVAIADAKYKYSYGKDRQHGTTREDLYQMIAYLNSDIGQWKNPDDKKSFLLYPDFPDQMNKSNINHRNYILNLTASKSKIIRMLLNDKMENIFEMANL